MVQPVWCSCVCDSVQFKFPLRRSGLKRASFHRKAAGKAIIKLDREVETTVGGVIKPGY